VRLTFYDQQYNFGNVANPAWSPDSSHIAFWLRLSEEKVVNIEEIPQYLAVMNVQTREVKVYCQTAGSTPGDFISWSSDGNQLIVNTRTLQDTAEPLLIDLIHLTKTILPTRNSFVEGWLTP